MSSHAIQPKIDAGRRRRTDRNPRLASNASDLCIVALLFDILIQLIERKTCTSSFILAT